MTRGMLLPQCYESFHDTKARVLLRKFVQLTVNGTLNFPGQITVETFN